MSKATLVIVAAALILSACSTNGEFYKEGDPVNGQFSVWRTIALPFAVAAVVVGAAAAGYAEAERNRPPQVSCTSTRSGNTVYTNCY